MITSKQLRAARSLLDLSQKTVSEHAGIGLNTLANSESDTTAPSAETARKLQEFYEGAGVQFLDDTGVKMQTGDREYRGHTGMRSFFNDVYEASRRGTEICIFNGVPNLLIQWAGDEFYQMHAARMTGLKSKIDVKVIVQEGETNLIGSSFAEYREINKELFNERTFYVYADRVAIFTFTPDLTIRVLVGKDLADSMRVLFNFAWESAK